ncbi:MAG: hypothetical protein HYT87_06045 [Nitrospirae bacterium]|nr:hypothetical protein [Nitrospirota bacterium]
MSSPPLQNRSTGLGGRVLRSTAVAGGFILTAMGLVFLFLPGPGLLLLFLGLTLLGTEFIWARRILEKVKGQGKRLGSIWENRRR